MKSHFPTINYISYVWCFPVSTGKTVIERNSHDSTIVSPDRDSYRTLYRKVQDAIDGKSQYLIDGVGIACEHFTCYERNVDSLYS